MGGKKLIIPTKEVKQGYYRHFEGNIYEFLFCGKSYVDEENTVICKKCSDGVIWVMPISEFTSKRSDGTPVFEWGPSVDVLTFNDLLKEQEAYEVLVIPEHRRNNKLGKTILPGTDERDCALEDNELLRIKEATELVNNRIRNDPRSPKVSMGPTIIDDTLDMGSSVITEKDLDIYAKKQEDSRYDDGSSDFYSPLIAMSLY